MSALNTNEEMQTQQIFLADIQKKHTCLVNQLHTKEEMQKQQIRLVDQFCNSEQQMKCFISPCYGKDIGRLVKNDTIDSVGYESKMSEFSNGYGNVVYHLSSLAPGDEPTKAAQKFNSVRKQLEQKRKMINFMGVIGALHYSHERIAANYSNPTINPFKYICISTNLPYKQFV